MQLARHTWSSRSFATRYRQRYAAIRAAVEAVLREGQSSGEFRADLEPGAECDTLCALFDGLAVAALADPARFPPTRLYELIDRQIDKLLTPSAETERRTRSSESAAANRRPARRAR
jgi:hypothetical protein